MKQKLILFLFYGLFCVSSQQDWDADANREQSLPEDWDPNKEWVSEEDWARMAHKWRPESSNQVPRARNQNFCQKIIPQNLFDVDYTPKVNRSVTYNSLYPCTPQSKIKQLSYSSTAPGALTCNGDNIDRSDDQYNAVFRSNGNAPPVTINLTNYTNFKSITNGNANYLECGVVSEGPCAGDILWGFGAWITPNQIGCATKGFKSRFCKDRLIVILGKCASRCTIGRSSQIFNKPVNNKGT